MAIHAVRAAFLFRPRSANGSPIITYVYTYYTLSVSRSARIFPLFYSYSARSDRPRRCSGTVQRPHETSLALLRRVKVHRRLGQVASCALCGKRANERVGVVNGVYDV